MSYVKSWWNKMIYLHDILGHTIKPPECHYLALSPTNENFLATPFLTGPDVVAALLAAVLSAEVTAMDARRDSRSIRVAMVANDGRESMRVERRRRELCLKLDKQLTTRNLKVTTSAHKVKPYVKPYVCTPIFQLRIEKNGI